MDEEVKNDKSEHHIKITGAIVDSFPKLFEQMYEDSRSIEESKEEQSPHNSVSSENFTTQASLAAHPSSGKKRPRKASDLDLKRKNEVAGFDSNNQPLTEEEVLER